jgi:hypothetical protein
MDRVGCAARIRSGLHHHRALCYLSRVSLPLGHLWIFLTMVIPMIMIIRYEIGSPAVLNPFPIFSDNEFSIVVKNSCKLHKSIGIQCSQACFMEEI